MATSRNADLVAAAGVLLSVRISGGCAPLHMSCNGRASARCRRCLVLRPTTSTKASVRQCVSLL